jgi:hypothetical protein
MNGHGNDSGFPLIVVERASIYHKSIARAVVRNSVGEQNFGASTFTTYER